MAPLQPARSQLPVALLGAGTAISLLGDSTLYTVLPRPAIAAQVGISVATVGLLLGINRAVRLLTNGAAGALYDRLPRRRLLVASLFLGAVSTLIFAVGYGPAPLLVSRLLWGAAWSGIWVGGSTAVLDSSGEHNRGRLSGQYQMWYFLGSGATALTGGFLTDLVGFRPALLIGGALTMLAALLWLVRLPHIRPAERAPRAMHARTGPFPWSAGMLTGIPLFVSRFVFSGVMAATAIIWLSGLIGDSLRLGSLLLPIGTLTGIYAALRNLVSLVGAGTAGRLSDGSGRRWLAVAAVMAAGAGGAMLSSSQLSILALGGALLAAVTAGGVQSLAPAIVGDNSDPDQRARLLGIVYTLGDIGSALGPPFALGLLRWLPVAGIYRLCAVLLVALVPFALWQAVQKPARRPVAQER